MSSESKSPLLLVVDGQPASLALMVEAIEARGFQVHMAEDGKAALRQVCQVRPDLILLNVELPGEDGFETCRYLKADAELQDVPILLMIPDATIEYKAKCIAAGCADYIALPLYLDEILLRVTTQLELAAVRRAGAPSLPAEAGRYRNVEARLALKRFALAQISEAVFLLDESGRFHYVNQAACERLGYTEDELLALSLKDIDPEWTMKHSVERWIKNQTRQLENTGMTFESRHLTRSGVSFPVEITTNYFDYGGKTYVLALARNVSERIKAETELRESEQRYREIFENAVEGMYLLEVTEEGRFRNLDINPALASSIGISREAMIGQFVDDTVPEDVGKKIVEKYQRVVAAGTTLTENITLDLPSGKKHYISTITPIRCQGRTRRLIGISRDITERVQMDEALAKREQEYRTLVENLPYYLIRYNDVGQAVYFNPKCAGLFPCTIDSILGKTPCEAFPDVEAMLTYQAALRRVIARGEAEQLEIEAPDLDGVIQTHQVTFVAEQHLDGHIYGALAIGRDVTALVETERRLEKSHTRLRELLMRREADLEEERRRIAREMHDELGQLLTAIRLGISALKLQFGFHHAELDLKLTRLLDLASQATNSVRAVATSLRPAALDMGIVPALQWLVDEFKQHGDAECRLSLSGALGAIDEMRAMAIFRTIQEALTNITRHADASVVEIELKVQKDNTYLLNIRDDGEGFDPSTTVTGHFGLIGISERIDSLGGTFVIDSAPDKGTLLQITIPCAEDLEASVS